MSRNWPAFVFALIVALVASFASLPANAQGEWKRLGGATVNGKVDKDTITVGADDGFFTAIQVKVEGSALEMKDIRVTFGDNSSFSPPTKLIFNPGQTTRVIDLPGEARIIKKIDFSYGNLPGGGNARVEVFGKVAPPQWKKLGQQTVNGKNDSDVIMVGGDDGLFSAIQVKVEGSSLEMKDIVVHFGNGTSFSPNTKQFFGPGQTTRVIDLPGERRVIKKVTFKYGNLPGGGNARVELWGRR